MLKIHLTIFCLSTNRKNQALQCLNELNKVNFNDKDILSEIALMFENIGEYEISANIYKKILSNERTLPDCYLKIADIYYNKLIGKKNEALEILKDGKKRVFEDNLKEKIEKMIELIEKEEENEMIGKESHNINFNDDNIIADKSVLNISESQLKDVDFLDDEEHEFKENEEKDNKEEDNKNEENNNKEEDNKNEENNNNDNNDKDEKKEEN